MGGPISLTILTFTGGKQTDIAITYLDSKGMNLGALYPIE